MKNEKTQTLLEEFKELILRHEQLEKDANIYMIAYIREFGELIAESFSLKIESIKLKKSIAFCQERKNRGQTIEQSEIDSYIEEGMDKYYQELEAIQKVREEGEVLTAIDFAKLKKLYYKIVNSIHPDLYPERFANERIQELWEKAKKAYQNNKYEELCDIELLIAIALEELDVTTEISVENLPAKIAKVRLEIAQILQNEPYVYKYLLEDDAEILRKQKELLEEIEEYKEYVESLKEELANFTIEPRRIS